MNIFFDGGLRRNTLRTCILADGHEPVVASWPTAKRMTSGHAEWLAAREAARFAALQAVDHIELVGDYENIIRHMDPNRSDAAPCAVEANAELAREIVGIVGDLRRRGTVVVWRHVFRNANAAGAHLEQT